MRYLLVILIIIAPLPASSADYRGECAILFLGSSTLHDFQGTARCQPFTVSEIDGVVEVPELAVAVTDMDTNNPGRDRKMREMFEAETFPLISGGPSSIPLKDIRAIAAADSAGIVEVSFPLKIRDTINPISATVETLTITDERITAEMVFTLSLAGYRLKPPTVLGFIRVADTIKVSATFVLEAR